MKFNLFMILIIAGLLLISCEDVIDINLENSEPRIVIEGTVSINREPFKVKISKSADYFQSAEFPPVSGAFVEITDDSGYVYPLYEVEPGLYKSDTAKGQYGQTYTLRVEIEGQIYTASSTIIVPPLLLGSVWYVYDEGDGFGEESVEGYRLLCEIIDLPDADNFGRFIIERNGVKLEEYSLYDGTWSDGKRLSYDWYGFDLGDTIIVYLQSIDEPIYDYFKTLSEIVIYNDSLKINWSPANPVSNISNNALGYFSAYREDSRIIIIK